jgi:membrane-associated phospholipid phosphatase
MRSPRLSTDSPNDVYLKVNEFARSTDWLHAPVTAYAKYGLLIFAVLLLVGWWVARRGSARVMAAALLAPVSTLVAVAVNQPIIKHFAEARPYAVHPQALVLVSKTTDPSFPSDHAAMAGAVTVGLLLLSWRLGLIAAVFGMAMAFARVYVGAHYPHDVIAGLAVGALAALMVWALLRIPITRLVERLRGSRLRLALAAPVRRSAADPAPVPA